MSKITKQDYRFGAALSVLLSKNGDSRPSLLEHDSNSRQYRMSTNTSEDFGVYMKYCGHESKTAKPGEQVWSFSITDSDKDRVAKCAASKLNTYILLICGTANCSDGEIIVLTQNEFSTVSHKSAIRVKLTDKKK